MVPIGDDAAVDHDPFASDGDRPVRGAPRGLRGRGGRVKVQQLVWRQPRARGHVEHRDHLRALDATLLGAPADHHAVARRPLAAGPRPPRGRSRRRPPPAPTLVSEW